MLLTESTPRKHYPSDVTDEQWAILEPLMPAARTERGGRPREVNLREVVNTIFYLDRSGCQWDMLPHDLLPKSTAYEYFAQWRDDGTWAKGEKVSGTNGTVAIVSDVIASLCDAGGAL